MVGWEPGAHSPAVAGPGKEPPPPAAAGNAVMKPGRNLIFLGDEDIGGFGWGNDCHRIGLDLEFYVCRLGDVVNGGAQRNIRQTKE